jgi:hypothetical protein
MPWTFGPSFPGHPQTVEMHEIRRFDVCTRAKAFRARTEAFFINQVDTIRTSATWAPFPLAVMTCIGIELISSYKYGDARGDSNDHFKKLLKDMHPRFGHVKITPEGHTHELAYFLYKGFRNTLTHGFYGKWVFITHQQEKAKTFRYSPRRGFVVLNVYWFYERFRRLANDYLATLVAATDVSRDPLLTFSYTFEKNFGMWI